MTVDGPQAPVACSLNAADYETRRAGWERLAQCALRQRQLTAHGIRLVFEPQAAVLEQLRELARLEAQCCGFADWQVRDGGQDGLILDVSARGDGVDVLQVMFEALGQP